MFATKRRQYGVTLVELLIALSVFGALAAGVSRLVQSATEDTQVSVAALHAKTVGDAAQAYIRENYLSVMLVASPTAPALVRVADLIAEGYLPSGFSNVNAKGQATCVVVLQPSPAKLQGLVITEGGEAFDDLMLGQLASTIGGSGGGIYSSSPSVVRGAQGGYEVAIGAFGNVNHLSQRCDGSSGAISFAPGHPAVALWFGDALSPSPTLYRDEVPSDPALNTMNTPILFGVSTVVVEGQACPTRGALARDSIGGVLACEADVWKKAGSTYWRDPVAILGALGVCDAPSRGHTRVVLTPAVGAGPRAYTCDGTGTWAALGVDDNGSIRVDGTATINRLAGTLEIGEVAVKDTVCVRNGSIAREIAGKLLSCQAGIWRAVGGGGEQGMYAYFRNAVCPDGWVAANGLNGTVDLRGEFIRSWDAGRGVDSGRALGSAQLDSLQHMYGTFQNMEEPFSYGNGVFAGGPAFQRWYGGTPYASAPGTMTFDSARVARSTHETRGRNVALLACMKQ